MLAKNCKLTYEIESKTQESIDKFSNEKITSIVTLSPDKLSIRINDKEKIFDFTKHIVVEVDHDKKTYLENSIFATFYSRSSTKTKVD